MRSKERNESKHGGWKVESWVSPGKAATNLEKNPDRTHFSFTLLHSQSLFENHDGIRIFLSSTRTFRPSCFSCYFSWFRGIKWKGKQNWSENAGRCSLCVPKSSSSSLQEQMFFVWLFTWKVEGRVENHQTHQHIRTYWNVNTSGRKMRL